MNNGDLRLVGTYRENGSSVVNGFLFEGTTADFGDAGELDHRRLSGLGIQLPAQHDGRAGRRQLRQPGRPWHGQLALGPGHAFIYDIDTDTFLTDIVFPGSIEQHRLRHLVTTAARATRSSADTATDSANNFDDPGACRSVRPSSSTTIRRRNMFSNWKSFNYPKGADYHHALRRASAASRRASTR